MSSEDLHRDEEGEAKGPGTDAREEKTPDFRDGGRELGWASHTQKKRTPLHTLPKMDEGQRCWRVIYRQWQLDAVSQTECPVDSRWVGCGGALSGSTETFSCLVI